MRLYQFALELAKEYHEGQTRNNGVPYFDGHIVPVVNLLKTKLHNFKEDEEKSNSKLLHANFYDMVLSMGALHDVEEDCNVDVPTISRRLFETHEFHNPLESSVARKIIEHELPVLNKKRYANYFDYIMAIKSQGFLSTIKTSDLEHNMSDLKEGSLKDKYRFAHYILNPHK